MTAHFFDTPDHPGSFAELDGENGDNAPVGGNLILYIVIGLLSAILVAGIAYFLWRSMAVAFLAYACAGNLAILIVAMYILIARKA